jgi:hypothetical protein
MSFLFCFGLFKKNRNIVKIPLKLINQYEKSCVFNKVKNSHRIKNNDIDEFNLVKIDD